MRTRGSAAWQVVLSDLALILFLTTLAASGSGDGPGPAPVPRSGEVAVYREGAGGLTLPQWLDQQPADPRVQLTVQARYAGRDFERVSDRAVRLAREAAESGFSPRLSLEPAAISDITVSLAYDAARDQLQAQSTLLRPDSLAR